MNVLLLKLIHVTHMLLQPDATLEIIFLYLNATTQYYVEVHF